MKLNNSILSFILCLLPVVPVSGYSQIAHATDTIAFLSVDSVFSIIEKKYHIRLFCEQELLTVNKLPLSVSDLKVEELFIKLEQILKCSYVTVDTSSFILMPLGSSTGSISTADGRIIIGDPKEYGRYKSATFTGVLLDGNTGDPLVGAVATIRDIKISTITDSKGQFTMNLPVGEYEVEFSYFNFNKSYQKIKLVSSGTASFNLIEKLVSLDEVIIHADKSGSNLYSTQMNLLNLDTKSIKTLPLSLGEKDLIKSLTLLPGIQSVGEFGSGFNVRGGSADQNLILLEDAPLFNSSHLFGLESVINPDGVSGVTLLKAGIPAQYGERASSITCIRFGDNPDKLQMKGGIGMLSSRLNMETPLKKGKADLLLGGRGSYSNWLLHKIPNTDLLNSNANFYDLQGLLTIKINLKNRLSLFAYYSGDNFTYDRTHNYSYSSSLGTFRWLHSFTNSLSSRLVSGYSLYNFSLVESDDLLPHDAYKIVSSIIYNSLKYNVSWVPGNKYSFDFGISGMLYRIRPGDKKVSGSQSTIIPVLIDREKGIESAAYISSDINITGNLSCETGLRYSSFALLGPSAQYKYNSDQSRSAAEVADTIQFRNNSLVKYYSGLEPRFSLRYTINKKSSVKMSFNIIHQYVNLISNTSVAIPSDIWKLSSPQTRPLIADQISAGYYRDIKQNSIETSIELYYKTLADIVEYKNGAQLLLNQNIETDLLSAYGRNYGIEVYVRKNSGKLTGWISYTRSSSFRYTTGTIKEDQINHNTDFPSYYDKPNYLNIVANYYITRRWHASASFCYSTGRPVTLPESKFQYGPDWLIIYSARNKYRLPDYHRLDISISCDESLRIKKKWKGTWNLSIINVYGRKNPYSSFYKKEIPVASNDYRSYSLYTLYIIGRPLPTLTYNFTF